MTGTTRIGCFTGRTGHAVKLGCAAKQNFHVFANLRNGGAGCISATANVNPAPIHKLYAEWKNADADAQQAALDMIRMDFQKFPMIPALKAAVAHWQGDADWARVRPPLVELSAQQVSDMTTALKAHGFDMPGLGKTN